MYNIRLIEYPTGYQIRVYGQAIGSVFDDPWKNVDWIDFNTGEVKTKDDIRLPKSLYDVWLDAPDVDFDLLGERTADQEAESLRVSMTRTKNMIYYIARSNVWEWFVTLTIAPSSKIDRYDFRQCSAKVRKWFDNLRQRKAPELYYLIVPEQHKDGAWHFHGLLGGCDGLSFVDSGKKSKGEPVYNFENWKFGFSTATAVQDTARVSSYISKYITKTLVQETKGLRRYWASANCKRAEVEEYLVEGEDLKEYIRELYEKMTWKKRVDNGFYSVDYFEIPKDSSK